MKYKMTLFRKLFIYFCIIIAIPSLILATYALKTGSVELNKNLKEQADISISSDLRVYAQILEEYRHKTYEISTNEELISLLKNNGKESFETKNVYAKLFDVMKGDTYKASVNIVSTDGKVRLSTHVFPDRYDLRYNNTESDTSNPIIWNEPSKQTLVSITNRYVNETGNKISLSFIRNVYDENNNNIGYVILDVYDVRMANLFNYRNFFDEELVINTKKFLAASLTDNYNYGNYLEFPFLNNRPENLVNSTIIKDNILYAIQEVPNTDLVLLGVIDLSHYSDNFYSVIKILSITLILGLMIGIFLAYHFSRKISNSIKNVIESMHKVEEGNLAIDYRESDIKELEELNDNFNYMVIQLVKLVKQVQNDERKASKAELKSLEAQLDPHFLFNTLNTIKALARINNQKEIYDISLKLGILLRSNLNNKSTTTTIGESVSLVNDYLTIQQIRFGDKLQVSYDIEDDVSNVVIPKLIIQPLVENSIKHGLEPKIGDWIISISAKIINSRLVICVADNGVGLKKDFNSDIKSFKNTSHVGLYNIYRRLDIHYNGDMSFSINREADNYTIARIELPLASKIGNLNKSIEQ